jgi:hypothetical protein
MLAGYIRKEVTDVKKSTEVGIFLWRLHIWLFALLVCGLFTNYIFLLLAYNLLQFNGLPGETSILFILRYIARDCALSCNL